MISISGGTFNGLKIPTGPWYISGTIGAPYSIENFAAHVREDQREEFIRKARELNPDAVGEA